jgi:hypothetical protein
MCGVGPCRPPPQFQTRAVLARIAARLIGAVPRPALSAGRRKSAPNRAATRSGCSCKSSLHANSGGAPRAQGAERGLDAVNGAARGPGHGSNPRPLAHPVEPGLGSESLV